MQISSTFWFGLSQVVNTLFAHQTFVKFSKVEAERKHSTKHESVEINVQTDFIET